MGDYNRKPRRVRYHFSLVFFAAVFIFGFMFYKYMTETTLEDVLANDTDSDTIGVSDNINDTTDQGDIDQSDDVQQGIEEGIINPVPESEAKTADYLNSCIFVGDSITYGLASYNVVPSTNVYASMSMSISKVETGKIDTQYGEMTIAEALQLKQPENIYVMLGSNGAAFMSVNDMYQSFSSFMKIVSEICPESNVYILSVPPVTAEKEASAESPISNADLDEFNTKILEYANRNDMYYVDISSALKDDSGKLPKADAENDGLHLKYSAYEKLINYVLTHTVG